MDIVTGDVLLLLPDFCFKVGLKLACMVCKLGEVFLYAVEDGLLLFVLGKRPGSVIDLEKQGEDHGIVCGLVCCIGGRCCRGWVGLETIDQTLEEREAGQRLSGVFVICEIARSAGDALSDPDEAGVEDIVARDLGVECLNLVLAGLALFVDVALLPPDEGAFVHVGVALDVGVV